MRAVNLIPPEQRRATTKAGRSGGGAWAVLGVLAVALVLITTTTLTGASIADRRAQLEQVRTDTAAARREVSDLRAYTSFAALRESRVSTVHALVSSRFDWAHALREVARTIPSRAWLSGLRATVSPSVTVEGGAQDPMRPALAVPAIEVQGCSTGQREVALLVADLRRIDGVQRVSLSSSEKPASGGVDAGRATSLDPAAGGPVDPCAQDGRPKFSLTVFFRAPAPSVPAAPGATTVSTTTP